MSMLKLAVSTGVLSGGFVFFCCVLHLSLYIFPALICFRSLVKEEKRSRKGPVYIHQYIYKLLLSLIIASRARLDSAAYCFVVLYFVPQAAYRFHKFLPGSYASLTVHAGCITLTAISKLVRRHHTCFYTVLRNFKNFMGSV
jgi:hypothetical protein